MPRPRDEERRLALATQACAVLEKEGLGISAERLASELGIKRPSLLYYFPDYFEILQAGLLDLLTQQSRFVSERVERESHPVRQLYVRVRATHEFHEGRGERLAFLTQALAAIGGARSAQMFRVASELFEAQRKDLVRRLEKGMREGTVGRCKPEVIVALCRAVIDGLTFQRLTGGSDADPVHALLWKSVLEPLIKAEEPSKRRRAARP